MNRLKAILYGTYVILVILLLLGGMRCCGERRNNFIIVPQPPITIQPDTVAADDPTPPSGQTERDREDIERANDIGESGDLKVTLLWDYLSDIDLHIIQPNGRKIWYQDKRDRRTGGYLDVDNTIGGTGSAENIFWENPPQGTYKVYLHYYRMGQGRGGECTVVVRQKGMEPQTYRVQMSRQGEMQHIVDININ